MVPEVTELTFDSMFHRLGATAEALQTYIEGDEQVAGWLPEVEEDTKELLHILATRHVEEALSSWESLEVSRLAHLMLPDLPQQAREANLAKLQTLADELGHVLIPKGQARAAGTPIPPITAPVDNPLPTTNERTPPHPPSLDMNALTAAVQAAMQPLVARLEAVERASARAPTVYQSVRAPTPADALKVNPAPGAATARQAPKATTGAQQQATPTNQEEAWTVVTKHKRKRGGKKPDQAGLVPQQINLTPRSYAATAAVTSLPTQITDSRTQTAPPATLAPPSLTEVTIIRNGGSIDNASERRVRDRQPDAIVREVKASIARAVAKPLPIIAGRWSSGTRSRGNFVFTMRGQIDFSTIQKFERFLTSPFPGGGQLCPNQGWTKLLAHGVPVLDNDDSIFGPDDLLRETWTMTGL